MNQNHETVLGVAILVTLVLAVGIIIFEITGGADAFINSFA